MQEDSYLRNIFPGLDMETSEDLTTETRAWPTVRDVHALQVVTYIHKILQKLPHVLYVCLKTPEKLHSGLGNQKENQKPSHYLTNTRQLKKKVCFNFSLTPD